ncbi:hypothetical protein GGR57DRAFT_119431 [Xylariaceae sp. FL1272]|nr:hypothetical protein GGR57DRAFT_119431 [Xylariaceae sp. FL1272]
MSQFKNARNMDDASGMGSVKRARQQAQAGGPRGPPPTIPGISQVSRRQQAPAGLQSKDGSVGMAISRPTPVPQWPLAGPIASPASIDSEPYRPPPGRSQQPPQRPPRPSRVPSILDASRVQDHTPVFQYAPQNVTSSDHSGPESSRPLTTSSVGSIPDFPLPVAAPSGLPRRSVNLGPPPSSRRGASSFYSTASFVSPIPEESPRIKSHTSYASSAAIPDSFGTLSPNSYSPNSYYFDDAIAEESVISDDADDRGLVRSASIGKRGKPSLITTKSVDKSESMPQRPTPKPVQGGPFMDGTGYLDGSSSSSAPTTIRNVAATAGLTADTMLSAMEAASATDPSSVPRQDPASRPFRLSGLRRPPRLDIDAVRAAEARGSLTSLPDLIRRATRLASMMDRGKRPGSRFDDLDFPDEIYGGDPEKNDSYELDKHQSGLSDMLAAFPPPASRRSMRQSVTSWPLPRRASRGPTRVTERTIDSEHSEPPVEKRRKCCGLPLWGFWLVVLIILIIIAAAIVIPIELLVVHKNDGNSSSAQSCTDQLTCANGGTNVVSQGVCSCICANGFTGTNCTIPTTQGCTTTTLDAGDTSIQNVTIGQAIPRLVLDANSNFSIPLEATEIISKFSSSNLSCNSENALVTFNGVSAAVENQVTDSIDIGDDDSSLTQAVVTGLRANERITLTVQPDSDATIILSEPAGSGSVFVSTLTAPTTFTGQVTTILVKSYTATPSTETTETGYPTGTPPTTMSTSTTSKPTSTSTTSSTTTSTSSSPTATFTASDQTLDFARVAVLYVLQEKSVEEASAAQNELQSFFSSNPTTATAKNVTVGDNTSVDLVNYIVDVGAGKVGGNNSD